MDPIRPQDRVTTDRPVPSLAAPDLEPLAAARAPSDRLRLSERARGVRVECDVKFLWMKQHIALALEPQADGSTVFSLYGQGDELLQRRRVGKGGEPADMVVDVDVRLFPGIAQALRVEVHQDNQDSWVRVTDRRSGRVIQEAHASR